MIQHTGDRPYQPRLADPIIGELLSAVPALMLVGPRAAGKTTTARRHAADILRLDRPAEAAAVRADPDSALRGRAAPLLIDEWQEVPEILGAVKRSVDDDPRAGRFLITGSVRAASQVSTWPGTGRIVQMPLYGLTQAEIAGNGLSRPFIQRLLSGEVLGFGAIDLTLIEYVQRAVQGGFPEVVLGARGDRALRAWFETYLNAVVSRDVLALSPRADPHRLRYYLESLALNNAGTPARRTLMEAAGVSGSTASRYDGLLADLFLAEEVPAWMPNRLKSLARRAKRYVVDPGLAAAAAQTDAHTIRSDGDLLGRTLDGFVVAQLRAEAAVTFGEQRLRHLRTQNGREEVDIIIELPGGKFAAIEVKATAAPRLRDARHLQWLQQQMGDSFVAGCVLHTGPRAFELGEQIVAAPIASLWEA